MKTIWCSPQVGSHHHHHHLWRTGSALAIQYDLFMVHRKEKAQYNIPGKLASSRKAFAYYHQFTRIDWFISDSFIHSGGIEWIESNLHLCACGSCNLAFFLCGAARRPRYTFPANRHQICHNHTEGTEAADSNRASDVELPGASIWLDGLYAPRAGEGGSNIRIRHS